MSAYNGMDDELYYEVFNKKKSCEFALAQVTREPEYSRIDSIKFSGRLVVEITENDYQILLGRVFIIQY